MGADPTKVQTYNIIDTYKTDLIDRFWKAGVDYTRDRELVGSLAHTVNKPLYGWLRRNRADQRLQDALDVALLEAVVEDEDLPVRLLLWAGADPHRKVPMARDLDSPDAWAEDAVFSSAEAAITFGRHGLLDLLRIESMPDLEAQASSAHDSRTLKKLVALRPPVDWSEVILAFIRRFASPHRPGSSWDARDALRFIESNGGRLTTVPPDQIRYLRSALRDERVAYPTAAMDPSPRRGQPRPVRRFRRRHAPRRGRAASGAALGPLDGSGLQSPGELLRSPRWARQHRPPRRVDLVRSRSPIRLH